MASTEPPPPPPTPPPSGIIHETQSESTTNQETENNLTTINHKEYQNVGQNVKKGATSNASQQSVGGTENPVISEGPHDQDEPSNYNNNQVNVNIETEINLKLTLIDILLKQPLIRPIYWFLSKRTGRLRIQRIIYFMGTFAISHSFLMLISFLPSTGLVDSFASRLDYMRFTLFLNDVTLFTMLNGILTLDPPFQLLNYLWTAIYSSCTDSPSSKNTIEIKQWIVSSVSFIRKRLYLVIILSTLIYLQLMVSIGLDSASNLLTITRIVDIVHIFIDLIGLLVILLLVYQFLIVTIFAQSIFRDICESFKEDKKILPWNVVSSPSQSINDQKLSAEVILSRRNRYCGIIEFTRTANNHWKNFLAIFVLSNFIPAVFQLHFILNKQLDEQQLVELIYRFVVNIVVTYIVIVNAKRVNHLSHEFYDDLYQLTLRESNDSTRLEVCIDFEINFHLSIH